MNGHGVVVLEGGTRYEGAFFKGLRHGSGTLFFPLRSDTGENGVGQIQHGVNAQKSYIKLIGEWESNELVGPATLVFPNSELYHGELKDGKMDGKGIYQYITGDVYDGEWCEGKRKGKGVMLFGAVVPKPLPVEVSSTSALLLKQKITELHQMNRKKATEVYDGEWENDKMHGFGAYSYGDGSTYEGYWIDGRRHNYGQLRYANGNEYKGEFACGKKEGVGTLVFIDGGSYEGEWYQDLAHGKGKVVYENGDVYVGHFSHGMKRGIGNILFVVII